jgi:hypothetical protein
MSTLKNKQGCSSDSDLLNAIQIVCSEVKAWLEHRPQLRDATRTIVDSILGSASVGSSSDEVQRTTSIDTDIETAAKPQASSESVIAADVTAKITNAELPEAESSPRPSTKLAEDVEQSILDLQSAVNQEVDEDTIFEPPVVNESCESTRTVKPRYSEVCDSDLHTMVERCRLKAEGARWAIERDERIRDGADFKLDVKPHDFEIIERAKRVPNCFLWMNQPRSDIRTQSSDFRNIAECFDALGETLTTLNVALAADDAEQFIESVQLVAEAQSALRSAVAKVEDHPDTDQQLAYHWLRNRASQDRFYISRFMKITDPADPGNCLNVQQQAIELRSEATVGKSNKQRNAWLEKARFHLRKISSDLDAADEYDWLKAADAINEWVADGGSIRSRELRVLMVPFVNEIPDYDFPANFESVIDVLIATSLPTQESADSVSKLDTEVAGLHRTQDATIQDSKHDEIARDRSLEVKQASNWLDKKRMVLFAGDFDPDVNEQIIRSLGIDSLEWVAPEEHHREIESRIDAVDLVAVLVTNQWEKLLWDEVSELTNSTGIPCVRLPVSCDPHQIAIQVIKQCPNNLSDGDIQSSVA